MVFRLFEEGFAKFLFDKFSEYSESDSLIKSKSLSLRKYSRTKFQFFWTEKVLIRLTKYHFRPMFSLRYDNNNSNLVRFRHPPVVHPRQLLCSTMAPVAVDLLLRQQQHWKIKKKPSFLIIQNPTVIRVQARPQSLVSSSTQLAQP